MPNYKAGTTEEQKKAQNDRYRATYRAKHLDRHKKSCHKHWLKNQEKYRLANRTAKQKRYDKLRAEWLDAYGGRCECCGITEPIFLTIEHTNGNGNAHRKEISGHILTWLHRNNWPKDGFGILCYNCNLAKGHHGVCPHKATSSADYYWTRRPRPPKGKE